MTNPMEAYYEKRGQILVRNLQNRHFEAFYCENKEKALEKALELIPEGARVGWGGAMSAQQIGLTDSILKGSYTALDRGACASREEQERITKEWFGCDYFLTGANAISLDGQMVNIDGTGNRVAAICYGPREVIVIAGMNKVVDTLEEAVARARKVAAPANQQRFLRDTPCTVTGTCGDCKKADCICNQIVVTRHCRPVGRIKFILVGEALGL